MRSGVNMEFPISDEGIRAAIEALLASADEAGISPAVGRRLAVILDEYSSNLIRHDPTIAADSRFWLSLEPCEGGAMLSIRDNAAAFDPTRPRPGGTPEIGGQGIGLIQGLAHDMHYRAEGGQNLFTVRVLETGDAAGAS